MTVIGWIYLPVWKLERSSFLGVEEKFLCAVTFLPYAANLNVDTCSIKLQEAFGGSIGGGSRSLAPFLVTISPDRDNLGVRIRATTFHELYSRYAADVYRFAHWLTGNPDDARDITSETFVRVWTAPEEPRMETVKAYLFAIARNLHNKQWRRQSRQVVLDEAKDETPDPAATPAEVAAAHDEFRRALRAVHALPELIGPFFSCAPRENCLTKILRP